MDFSSLDWKWAVRLANRGYDADQIADLIRRKPRGNRGPYSLKFLRILESRGLDWANAYACTTAQKAVAWVRANPPIRDPSAGRAAVAEIREAADSMNWLIHGGPGPRRALEGLFVVADRLGSVSFGLANRAWAELVGMTVSALLRRRATLIELGWLRRNPSDRQGRTARYVLQAPDKIEWCGSADSPRKLGPSSRDRESGMPDSLHLGTAPAVPPYLSISLHPCVGEWCAYLAHDAFRPSALGDLGWYEVAAHLKQDGIGPLLDRLAVEYGTAGASECDRERHRRDRQEFRGRRSRDAS